MPSIGAIKWQRRQNNPKKGPDMSQPEIANSAISGFLRMAALIVSLFWPANLASWAEEAETPAPPQWESSAAVGLSLTRGNSDTLLISGW
jgi:hypothetical protein